MKRNKLNVNWWSFIWGSLTGIALLHPSIYVGLPATIGALLFFVLWWANEVNLKHFR